VRNATGLVRELSAFGELLHGHIHESRGAVKIGRTLCINPGSEYASGILQGALIELSPRKGIKSYQLPAG
jgi:Icc-related predicted phosphoesterase